MYPFWLDLEGTIVIQLLAACIAFCTWFFAMLTGRGLSG
jgi:hypothetical protein